MTGCLALLRLHAIPAALLILASGAAAQTANPPPLAAGPAEKVIVTGHKPAQSIDAVVSQFVQLHAAPNRKTGQYMRDDVGPICPFTVGLPPAYDDFVTARVVAVASNIGARTNKTGTCKPNVEILFTDKPEELVRSLDGKTHGAILGMHYVHEKPSLLEITRPIQGWYVTGTRYDENSIEPVKSYGTDGTAKDAGDKMPVLDSAYRRPPEATILGSKIPMRRISTIVNVLIVADINKVGGSEIGPIADYIAMLALSEPRSLDDCNELPSIFDLLAQDCGARPKPQALTESDLAYLKALYAADLGATTISVQKDNIDKGMKTHLGDAGASTNPQSAQAATAN
jgi:hypothetical protein